jgi:hypothetical protein
MAGVLHRQQYFLPETKPSFGRLTLFRGTFFSVSPSSYSMSSAPGHAVESFAGALYNYFSRDTSYKISMTARE